MTNEELLAQIMSSMDQKFEAMQNVMDQKFEAMQNVMDQKMDQKFEAMQNVMDQKMDQKFDAMQNIMDQKFETMEARLKTELADTMKQEVELLTEIVQESERRVNIKIENDVLGRINSLFDGYKLTHEKQFELEKRVEVIEGKLEIAV